eukprot:gene8275-3517_t
MPPPLVARTMRLLAALRSVGAERDPPDYERDTLPNAGWLVKEK